MILDPDQGPTEEQFDPLSSNVSVPLAAGCSTSGRSRLLVGKEAAQVALEIDAEITNSIWKLVIMFLVVT